MTAVPAITVALVEDDASFREAVSVAIDAAPGMVPGPVAGSRAEALAMLAGPAPDVMLVDLGLPDGSGLDVIRAASRSWADCEVMVATTVDDEAQVMACIEAGASGYLLKDASAADIVAAIRALHAGGSPISPFIARRLLQRLQGEPLPVGQDSRALLSAREAQVLRLVARGFSYEEIAEQLAVSRHTVSTFVRRIYSKLEVGSKMEAVNAARRRGLLPD